MTRRRFCIGRDILGIFADVAALLSRDDDVRSASLGFSDCHGSFLIVEDSSSESSADERAGLKVISIAAMTVAEVRSVRGGVGVLFRDR